MKEEGRRRDWGRGVWGVKREFREGEGWGRTDGG